MKYKCLDSGSERCPCDMIKWGECYTCQMTGGGQCDCGNNGQWAGVCPFSEYVMNGKRKVRYSTERTFKLSEVKRYNDELFVLHIGVTSGFAQMCSRPGTFVMIKSLGYETPFSVIKARVGDESFIEIAVKAIGPKSRALMARVESNLMCAWIDISGPFFSGLVNFDLISEWKKDGRNIVIAARGMAAAPVLNCLEWIYGSTDKAAEIIERGSFFIDEGNVPEKFFFDYFGNKLSGKILKISFVDEMDRVVKLAEEVGTLIFLASPFYTELMEKLHPELLDKTVFPNHANMCCGRGICGSCSYVDKDGVTVKKCKCNFTAAMLK